MFWVEINVLRQIWKNLRTKVNYLYFSINFMEFYGLKCHFYCLYEEKNDVIG
jgi:hypothetical protein